MQTKKFDFEIYASSSGIRVEIMLKMIMNENMSDGKESKCIFLLKKNVPLKQMGLYTLYNNEMHFLLYLNRAFIIYFNQRWNIFMLYYISKVSHAI